MSSSSSSSRHIIADNGRVRRVILQHGYDEADEAVNYQSGDERLGDLFIEEVVSGSDLSSDDDLEEEIVTLTKKKSTKKSKKEKKEKKEKKKRKKKPKTAVKDDDGEMDADM